MRVVEVKMVTYKQDAAPGGGYGPFEWAKRAPKKMFTGATQITGFVVFTTAAWILHGLHRKKLDVQELEMRDARIAVEPFLLAEQDRAILKHYRKNRDEENELMKDVEGWKTGTLWGEPVYHNVRDRYIQPSLEELIVHMSPREKRHFLWDKLYR